MNNKNFPSRKFTIFPNKIFPSDIFKKLPILPREVFPIKSGKFPTTKFSQQNLVRDIPNQKIFFPTKIFPTDNSEHHYKFSQQNFFPNHLKF